MRCVVVLAALLTSVLAATAQALPGDPPPEQLAPADGAAVPTDPDGIAVSFTCPVYGVFDSGGFPFPGGSENYAVRMASTPALGADGRLSDWVSDNQAQRDPAADGRCLGALGAGGSPPRPQETPGTYYWQVSRICTGCDRGYETSGVRRIVLRANAALTVRKPGKVFAGYAVIVPLELTGLPDGTTVTVQRERGQGFKKAGSATALGEGGEAVVTLPKGTQTLRASAQVGSETVTSPELKVKVRAPRRWATSRRDTGAYRGKAGSRSVKFKVAAGGRELRGFKAFVPMTCPGVDPGTFTTQIGTAAFRRIRIAPDGRFVAAASPDPDTTMRVRGRLTKRKVKGGRVELSVGPCAGSAAYTARRR